MAHEDGEAAIRAWLGGVSAPVPVDAMSAASTAERMHEALERSILAGDLPPGSSLEAATLADRFRVPAIAVHAALGSLARARLVVTGPDDRSFVRIVDMGEAKALCEVRASLELLVGRLAARNAGPAELDELNAVVEAMRLAVRAGDESGWRRLDWRFHDRLARIAGNAALSSAYRTVANEFELFLGGTPLARLEDLREPTREHRHVLEALERRKPTRAANLLHEHALAQAARLWALANDGPFDGPAPAQGLG